MVLTVRFVQTASPGKYCDGGGLWLQVSPSNTRSWYFRYTALTSPRERYMGLGPFPLISLAEARRKAADARKLRLEGVDPIEARKARQRAARLEAARAVTFKADAEAYMDLHLDSFKNKKHKAQWRSTLVTYVYPKIGNMIVADIGSADLLRCIEPIWHSKHVTATRVLERVTRVLDYATTREHRTGDNPASHVVESLPEVRNGKEHHAALPYAQAPEFMFSLRARDSLAARALEFLVLTAARTGELLGATWDEIDLKAKTWTISGARMKSKREHKVPLCARAVEILQGLGKDAEKNMPQNKRVFPLSDWTMRALLQELRPGITIHGFRSSFRDWCAEQSNFPREVAEMALAHAIPSAVEAAYRRGNLFEKRIKLMHSWGQYCGKPISTGSVTLLRKTF